MLSRYTMLSHGKATPNPGRFSLLLETEAKWKYDGLSDLRYDVLSINRNPLFTMITVHLHKSLSN